MRRGELTDQQWNRLSPLLPAQKPKTGRPNHDHRQVINGILWILRTGAPWRDLPERYGKWTAVSSRFYRWRKAGIWGRIWAELQTDVDGLLANWDVIVNRLTAAGCRCSSTLLGVTRLAYPEMMIEIEATAAK